MLIQPRLTERRQLLLDRYVLTADEVAALPQGTLPVVLDRRLGQDQNDFRFRLLKLVLERSGTPFALGFSAAVQPQDEAIAALAEDAVVRSLYPQMLLDPHLLIVYPFAGFSMWLQRTRSWQPRFRPVLNG